MSDVPTEIEFTVVLIGITFTVIVHTISLLFLPCLIIRMRKKLSIHFLINIVVAALAALISFPYSIQLLYGWNGISKLLQ